MLCYAAHSTARRSERHQRHNRQLYEYRHGDYLDVVGRSALGAASVYNLLPQEIVDAENVQLFQRSLQDMARYVAASNRPEWQHLYSTRHSMHIHASKQV